MAMIMATIAFFLLFLIIIISTTAILRRRLRFRTSQPPHQDHSVDTTSDVVVPLFSPLCLALSGAWHGKHDYAVLYLDEKRCCLRFWSLRRGMAMPEGRIQVGFVLGDSVMSFLNQYKVYVLEHSLPVLHHAPYFEKSDDATAPAKERVMRGLRARLAAAHTTADVSKPCLDRAVLGKAEAEALTKQLRSLLRQTVDLTASDAAATTQAPATPAAGSAVGASVMQKSAGADPRVEPRGQDADAPSWIKAESEEGGARSFNTDTHVPGLKHEM